ncbi:hypothetical protein Pcinc_015064 [Petrolisthes cinctipes]|uniref:Uncharacterized protein n=1 Tax=Petrolisthes cinctipes TaxID=88211 RepID=A0AAE1KR65_PETCI|nr:hypothetical protein Pcinc_015064 [Petrolisthes cinctipes]
MFSKTYFIYPLLLLLMVTFNVLDVQGQRFRGNNQGYDEPYYEESAEYVAGGWDAQRPGVGSLFTDPGRPAPRIQFSIPQRQWWQQY